MANGNKLNQLLELTALENVEAQANRFPEFQTVAPESTATPHVSGKLQNFLSSIQTYIERQADKPYWGHTGERTTGRLLNAAMSLLEVAPDNGGPPKTAEESFKNFTIAISAASMRPIAPGHIKTLKEIWEISGKPFIKIDPELERGQPAYFKPEGMKETYLSGSSLLSEVGVPSYVSEQRLPVDTVVVRHQPIPMFLDEFDFDVRKIQSEESEALGWAMGGGRENILEDFFGEAAHAKHFGPDLYEYQYPEGTPYGEIPTGWLDWGQPKTQESLQKFAERRGQKNIQATVEQLLLGESRYQKPESGEIPVEYEAHELIEPELKSLYRERYAPRKKSDVGYDRLSAFMGMLQLMGYGSAFQQMVGVDPEQANFMSTLFGTFLGLPFTSGDFPWVQ
jgi:hypothetical protein